MAPGSGQERRFMVQNTLSLRDLVRSRRSINTFTNQPVPVDLVQDLLESAVYAPNHRLTEPWRFIYMAGEARQAYATVRGQMVVDHMSAHSEADRQKATEGTYQKFIAVPAYLIVAMPAHTNPEIYEEDYAACACVIQNFLLLAWDQGLGTNWKTFKNDPRLRQVFGLAADEKVVGIIHVGYPTDETRTSRRQMAHTRLTILT
jgi:nitroreductase